MTRVLVFAAAALFAAGLSAQDKDAPAKKKMEKIDPAKLVGSYKLVSGMKAGEKMTAEAEQSPIVFTKDKITMKSKDMAFAFSYKVDEDKTPATIEMTITEPKELKDKKATGILKMEAGKLVLCYHPKGENTPKVFKSTKENEYHLFELKKDEKKGKGKKKDAKPKTDKNPPQ